MDRANGNHHDATRTRTSDTANAVRQRDAMARGAGGAPVRGRFGQRANQWTGRRWARGAEGQSHDHQAPGRRPPKRQRPTRRNNEPPAEPQAQAPPSTPDGFKLGGSTFKPGGRIKLDIIRDFSAITSEDSFDTCTIAMDGSERRQLATSTQRRHACPSTYAVRSRGKELKMYVETDFYGSSSVLRLRQAYGSYGGLVGRARPGRRSWTSPTFQPRSTSKHRRAFHQIRQAQRAGRRSWAPSGSWSVAVEDNKSSIQIPTGIEGKAEYPMPDLVTNFRYQGLELARAGLVFLGEARFRPEVGDNDDVTLWGGLLSAKTKTFGRDNALWTVHLSATASARYRSGGVTAVPDANNQLHAVGLNAFMGGYEHYWSSRYSSNADLTAW